MVKNHNKFTNRTIYTAFYQQIKEEVDPSSPFHDHDYFVVNTQPPEKSKKKVSYIEADVPPQGYGFVDTGTSADKNGVGGNR